jgi:hypothetical protein
MVDFTYPFVRGEVSRGGTWHSWWLPGTPVDGIQEHTTYMMLGQNFTISHKKDRDGKYRSGDAWLSNKREIITSGDFVSVYRPGFGLAYEGYCVTVSSENITYDAGYVSDVGGTFHETEVLTSYGAQAYAALKPDQPDFEPMASLLELRSAPGDLWDRHKRWREKFKKVDRPWYSKAGRYHLAIQFGWLPLISDTLDFTQAFCDRKKRFDQMWRDAGKPVRRRRLLTKFGNVHDKSGADTSYWTYGTPYSPNIKPTFVTQCYGGGLATSKFEQFYGTRVWCAGRSRYFLPVAPDRAYIDRMHSKILGLYIDPNAVYNAIPWTWLGDYFGTLGNLFDAISPNIADYVVFDYAYVMHHKEYHAFQTETQWVCVNLAGTEFRQVPSVTQWSKNRKSRITASPLGFGFKEADLTVQQMGILGALGLSKL